MPTITLIQPRFLNRDLDRNIKTLYPIGLGYLAAYVPDHWDVKIIDEQIEDIPPDIKSDLIGISTTTVTAIRAYELAQSLKQRGISVVLGGVHASMCPEEASRYADAVCIGDGEGVMGTIVEDFEQGRLQPYYYGNLAPLEGLKKPRHELFRREYSFIPVSTSRGCPFNCNFCAINRFYQGVYRTRDVEDVMKELTSLPGAYDIVFFSDGNMYGYSQSDIRRFKDICRRIIEEKVRENIPFKYFLCYTSVNALEDEEALDLAAEAGCAALFVGFESINPDALREMNKKLNLKYGVDSYKRMVENAHKRKILVVGEMVVGNDSDTPESLRETEVFLDDINFDILRLQILQPLPGTKLFESLESQGRLYLKNFPEDWQKLTDYFTMGVHFSPKNMKERELQLWVKRAGLSFYSPRRILRRALGNFIKTGSLKMALTTLVMSFKSRKTYANVKL